MAQEPAAIEQAGQTLFDELYVPTLAKQCAARGVDITTPEEMQSVLESVDMLKRASAVGSQEGNGSLHKQANLVLRQTLGTGAADEGQQRAEQEQQFAKLASETAPSEAAIKASSVLTAAQE